MNKHIVCLGWGSHGSGKTFLLERLEREFYGRFIPCFGDLYGNKLEQPDKIKLTQEAYSIGCTVIMEGKRFVDNSFFESIVNSCEKYDKESILLIAYSQPAASIERVNKRRVQRGQQADFQYQEGREQYECVTRFENKIRTLYEEHPVQWSAVNLFHLDVTDVAAWEPFYQKLADHLKDCPLIPDVIESDPQVYQWLSYFWNSRKDALNKKGQEYSDFKPSPDFKLSNNVAATVPLTPSPALPKAVLDKPVAAPTDAASPAPKPKAPPVRSMDPILAPVPYPQAERVQMSKVRRGLRNAGFAEWEKLTDEQIQSMVGGLMFLGINPAEKGSDMVGKRCLGLAQVLVGGGAVAPAAQVITPTPTPAEVITTPVPVAADPTPTPPAPTPLPPPPLPPTPPVTTIMIGEAPKLSPVGQSLREMLIKTMTPVEAKNPVAVLGLAIHVPEGASIDSEPLALEEVPHEIPEVELPMRPPDDTEASLPEEPVEKEKTPIVKEWKIAATPTTRQGFIEFENCQDAYLYVLQDMLCNAPVTKRGHLLFLSFKPYTMSVKNADDYQLCLPGSLYYDPIGIMPRYAVEWMEGDIVSGGYSYRFDARRQRRYPKASGQIDWSIKDTLAPLGDDGLNWVRRNLRCDSTSRNASISVWDNVRDLRGYTARKEQDMQRGDSYSRLACPLNFSFTRDDGDKENKKALQTYASFRAMDFTTAIHSDMMRLGEASHWLALTTENRSYNGRMKMDIASIVFESYGASQFVYFNNLMDWWKSDADRCLRIHKIYQWINNNNPVFQSRHVAKCQQEGTMPLQWGQPTQKSYDWFGQRWVDFQRTDYHWRKGQWWHINEQWTKIAYTHWQDISLAVAITEMTLMESLKPEIVRLYGTNKQVVRSLGFEAEVGMYLPFYFMEKIKGVYHYYIMVYLISYLIGLGKFDLLDQMSGLPSVVRTNLFDVALSDALVSQIGKRARDKFIAARPELYSKISAHCNVIMERK